MQQAEAPPRGSCCRYAKARLSRWSDVLVLRPAGYAFSTYGEVGACWVQDVVLVGLIARHMRTGHKRLAAAAAAFAVYCWWLVSGLCSVETLTGAGSQRPPGQTCADS